VGRPVKTDRFGIDAGYHDVHGVEHATSAATRAALRVAMGAGAEDEAPQEQAEQAVRVLLPGGDRALPGGGDLTLEDGSQRTLDSELPEDLPTGYHQLFPRDGGETLLIVSPGRCFFPDQRAIWGFAAQLYAARSRASWGIGDLADLARLGRWSTRLGGGVLMINPLCAATPVPPIEASPYYPSSRRFGNPLYLRVEEVLGWEQLDARRRERFASAGHALNAERRIDRDVIFKIKMEALEAIFARFEGDSAFDWYRSDQGQALTDFATYCVLAERHGKDWRRWPAELRRADSAGTAAFRIANKARVNFHAWLQWQVDTQCEQAAQTIAIMTDLPIGLDVAGADAWCWQDLLAQSVSVGAPPDEFNTNGQDWGLTPFIPFRLRAARYQPFIETIRAMIRNAGGLRIDHVMGLFRLFWIPRALGTKAGAYVRSRADELLAIVALESERARAFVVGEDLGTVEAGVREQLAAYQMLSYRLLYFEANAPAAFPELALSSITTHDLPTLAGLWTGADADAQTKLGIAFNRDGMQELRDKVREAGGLAEDAPVELAIASAYHALAEAPSRILLATLDDALAEPERPNLPGTVAERPNWSLALRQPLEEIEELALPKRIALALARD
jgi:4-alpha-glucanotransferase